MIINQGNNNPNRNKVPEFFISFYFQTILKQLTDMGFKETRAKKALILNRLVNL